MDELGFPTRMSISRRLQLAGHLNVYRTKQNKTCLNVVQPLWLGRYKITEPLRIVMLLLCPDHIV